MSYSLQDRRVLVVGAGGGIGAATVRAFAAAGARVDAGGRNTPPLEVLGRETGAEAVELDVLDNEGLERWFASRPAYDHVVIAAARTRSGSVAALPLEDARASMDSKFWGAYQVARAARLSAGGSITFVSGFLSKRPSGGAVLQGSINAALDALAKGLALERAPIRVNSVSPGLINTPLWSGMPAADREAMFARTSARLPARRVGQSEDIAQAVLFVATNPYVTGTVVTVDGGGTIA